MFSNINLISISFSIVTILLFLVLIYLNFSEKKVLFIKNYKYRYSKKLKFFALGFSIIFLLIALFEPRGKNMENIKSEKKGDIVFLLDLTRSMEARDINYFGRNISRLDYAKIIVEDIIEEKPDFNYGIAGFAGIGKKISPITSDLGIVKTLSSGLDYENILVEGANFEDGILKSVEILKKSGGTIILITDGGENGDFETSKISGVLPDNIQLITLGVGDESPSKIPIGVSPFGTYIYKTFNGQTILTSLNKENIKKLGNFGEYYYLKKDNIVEIIGKINNDLKGKIVSDNLKERENISIAFLIISFTMFILYIGVMSLEKTSLIKKEKRI